LWSGRGVIGEERTAGKGKGQGGQKEKENRWRQKWEGIKDKRGVEAERGQMEENTRREPERKEKRMTSWKQREIKGKGEKRRKGCGTGWKKKREGRREKGRKKKERRGKVGGGGGEKKWGKKKVEHEIGREVRRIERHETSWSILRKIRICNIWNIMKPAAKGVCTTWTW
jgi:hypothetical protein